MIPGAQEPGPHSIIVESMTKYDQPIQPLSWMFNTDKGEWSIMDEISYNGKIDGRASSQAPTMGSGYLDHLSYDQLRDLCRQHAYHRKDSIKV